MLIWSPEDHLRAGSGPWCSTSPGFGEGGRRGWLPGDQVSGRVDPPGTRSGLRPGPWGISRSARRETTRIGRARKDHMQPKARQGQYAGKWRAETLRAERWHAERSRGERWRAEKSRAERSHAERSHAERSHAERSHAERSHAERSHAEGPRAERSLTHESPVERSPVPRLPPGACPSMNTQDQT